MARTALPSRRTVLAGGLAGLAAASAAGASISAMLRIRDDRPGLTVSPLVFGSNEIGVMDGGLPSAHLDRLAGVTARRLGGDLMTGYNWVTNATNAGKNHRQSNGAFLLEALQIPRSLWTRPAVVIEAMHEASLDLGARSLVTLPLAGYAAADMNGPVSETDTAPSARFVPVRWALDRGADDPVDPHVADMPQLLARLIARYGDASGPRGIHAYALDNEPALWFQNHPRLTPRRVTIRSFIARSIEAARAIKALDPAAKVFGPASWGATGMVSFQNAPDWSEYRHYGTFLAAYLDAFRIASEHDGRRLLDTLDVHWYAFHRLGDLFRHENGVLDEAALDAPRSLTEPGFREDSWVPRAFRPQEQEGLGLPILPSLAALAARWFPGTALAVTEFNYGGAGRLASGLAVADALGRLAGAGVSFASHWGSLDGWLREAYRLYRLPDASGRAFGGRVIPLEASITGLSAHAAEDDTGLRLVLINRTRSPLALDIGFASGAPRHPAAAFGFDAVSGGTVALGDFPLDENGGWRLILPPRSARRYDFA